MKTWKRIRSCREYECNYESGIISEKESAESICSQHLQHWEFSIRMEKYRIESIREDMKTAHIMTQLTRQELSYKTFRNELSIITAVQL